MDIPKLAVDFSQQVRERLAPEEVALAVGRNQTPEYAGCCATHDFCDANMLMLDAMQMQGEELDPDSQRQVSEITAAWDKARRLGFDVEALKSSRANQEAFAAIAEQLGGLPWVGASTGAKDFVAIAGGLQMRLLAGTAKDGINLVAIQATGEDYYDLTCSKLAKLDVKLIRRYENLFVGDLLETFREATGLELRKPTVKVKSQGLQA